MFHDDKWLPLCALCFFPPFTQKGMEITKCLDLLRRWKVIHHANKENKSLNATCFSYFTNVTISNESQKWTNQMGGEIKSKRNSWMKIVQYGLCEKKCYCHYHFFEKKFFRTSLSLAFFICLSLFSFFVSYAFLHFTMDRNGKTFCECIFIY